MCPSSCAYHRCQPFRRQHEIDSNTIRKEPSVLSSLSIEPFFSLLVTKKVQMKGRVRRTHLCSGTENISFVGSRAGHRIIFSNRTNHNQGNIVANMQRWALHRTNMIIEETHDGDDEYKYSASPKKTKKICWCFTKSVNSTRNDDGCNKAHQSRTYSFSVAKNGALGTIDINSPTKREQMKQ